MRIAAHAYKSGFVTQMAAHTHGGSTADELEDVDVDNLLDDLLDDQLVGHEFSGCCWGREMCGASARQCTPGFVPARGHFKNKFCRTCRDLPLVVSAHRVCVISAALHHKFSNANGRSFWTAGARLVNQTAKCVGPAIVIFAGRVPEAMMAGLATPMPDEWIFAPQSDNATVSFIISKGTLVPTRPL